MFLYHHTMLKKNVEILQLLIATIFASIISAQVKDKGRIEIVGGNSPILAGDSFSLNCSHNYGNDVQYNWLILHSPKHHYYKHESFLEFQQIDKTDDVLVSCQIIVLGGIARSFVKTSKTLRIRAFYMDEPKMKVLSKSTWNVQKDDQVSVKCAVDSQPNIKYYELQKHGVTFHRSYLSPNTFTYNFGRIKKSDEGLYSCKTYNTYFSKTSKVYSLTVGDVNTNIIPYVAGVCIAIFILIMVCCFVYCRYSFHSKTKTVNTTDIETSNTSQLTPTSASNDIARGRSNAMTPLSAMTPSSMITLVSLNTPPSYEEVVASINYGFELPSYNDAIQENLD